MDQADGKVALPFHRLRIAGNELLDDRKARPIGLERLVPAALRASAASPILFCITDDVAQPLDVVGIASEQLLADRKAPLDSSTSASLDRAAGRPARAPIWPSMMAMSRCHCRLPASLSDELFDRRQGVAIGRQRLLVPPHGQRADRRSGSRGACDRVAARCSAEAARRSLRGWRRAAIGVERLGALAFDGQQHPDAGLGKGDIRLPLKIRRHRFSPAPRRSPGSCDRAQAHRRAARATSARPPILLMPVERSRRRLALPGFARRAC